MRTWRLLAVAFLAVGLLGGVQADEKKADNKTLIVGVWEVTKGTDGPPIGATLEFTKEGKVKMTAKRDGQEVSKQGTYTVEGDKVTVDGDGRKESATIKKLTEKELVLEIAPGKTVELTRKK
jgi:uncharacterized protein (TIGR03066 family)